MVNEIWNGELQFIRLTAILWEKEHNLYIITLKDTILNFVIINK